MSTERVINEGLFSLRMSPGLASKAMIGVFLFEEGLELIFIHDTSVKEMHMDQAVSVLGVVSLWVDPQTLHVFPRANVNVHTYNDDILDAYVSSYTWAIGDPFMLQVIMRDHPGLESWMPILSRKQFSAYSGQLKHRTLTLSNMFGRRVATPNPPPRTPSHAFNCLGRAMEHSS
ncbi:uncharacterized protein TNCV_1036521 [Trichonephila clavipes]|nr:uncharacterized protein TNCV_1036521 [Trichonephila clavipes]